MEVVKAMRALITITKKQLFEPALKLTNLLLSQIAIEQFNKKDKELRDSKSQSAYVFKRFEKAH